MARIPRIISNHINALFKPMLSMKMSTSLAITHNLLALVSL